MKRRPGRKELDNKINKARQHLSDRNWMASDYEVFLRDCDRLDLCTYEEQHEALCLLFEEVRADNYIGKRPPAKAYHESVKGRDLFEFCFWWEHLREEIYLKFAVDEYQLYIVSFHRSEKKRC